MPTITGTAGADNLLGTTGNDEIFGLEGNDVIDALDGDDLIEGGDGGDTITDGAGSDTVLGGAGSDNIIASPGSGSDSYDGGNGASTDVDVVLYSNALAGVIVDLNLAADQARSVGSSDAAGIGIDQLLNIEGVAGSDFADTLTGNSGNNVLIGRAGGDTLRAGDGDDLLNGGDGDDVIDGGAGRDRASYSSADGAVRVSLLIAAAQATGQGSDTLTGIEDLTGGRFGDTLIGSDGNNALNGAEGDDSLYGQGGDDELNPGLGFDRMFGGLGNDTYYVRDVTDYTYERANEGTDLVFASVSHSLRVNIEELRLTGSADLVGKGNDIANTITGNGGNNKLYGLGGDDLVYGGNGNDTLVGGLGVDRLFGGEGDDTYQIDDTTDYTFEKVGEGLDRVFSSINYTLRAHVENLTLTGTANLKGTGNDLANLIQGNSGSNTLAGGDGNDRLIGHGGADYLSGGDGADILEGGVDRDRFLGGIGSDTFVFKDGDFAGVLGAADQIIDFSRPDGDIIRLDAVDADVNLAGDQAFTFLGTDPFTGAAGELRYEQIQGNTYVQGDTDGDGTPDFWIRLDGLHVITGVNLIL